MRKTLRFLLGMFLISIFLCGCDIAESIVTELYESETSFRNIPPDEKLINSEEEGLEEDDESYTEEEEPLTEEGESYTEEEASIEKGEPDTKEKGSAEKSEPDTKEKDLEEKGEPDTKEESPIDEDGQYTDKDNVALYIHTFGKLPSNYITKNEAQKRGWNNRENTLNNAAPGMSIGGDRFGNYEGLLPKKQGRTYKECDIDYKKGSRNAKRIVFSNDGLIFYTDDHYATFEQLY